MRWRTGLFAALCALASFDALADPYARAFGIWFLAVAGGCLACIVVELAAGKAVWYGRLATGVGFAIANVLLYIVFLNILITAAIASSADSPSGSGPFVLIVLAAWVLPAARLWWLLVRRAPPRA